MTFRLASFQDDKPMNELFKAVENKIPGTSSTVVLQRALRSAKESVNLLEISWDLFRSELKEGKIHDIVALFPEENLVDCCSSSTMEESVLETDKAKRFAPQGWNAFKNSPFYDDM